MRSSTLVCLSFALVAPLTAQNCFNGAPAGVTLGNATDTIHPAQPIGFAFPLAGTTYTDIHVSDHGLCFLSNAGVPAVPAAAPFVYTPSLANFGVGNPIIAAMWSDTIPGFAGNVYVNGSATSCRVEWRNMESFGLPTPTFSLAMTLFPNGNIQFDYDPAVTNNSTFGGVSDNGIVGVTPGGLTATSSDLSAGGATASNQLFENWTTANGFDMQNNSLLLIPTNPGWSYVLLGSSPCATSSNYGSGCGGDPADSIYEEFNSASFDLAATTITWLRIGGAYVASNGGNAFVAPTAAAQPVAVGQLDGQQQFTLSSPMPIPGGTTTTVNVTTKGQVELDGTPGLGVDFSPTAAELLNWPNTAFHCWHDFNQVAGGAITFEEIGGTAYVTWNAVASFNSASTSTLQWQFERSTGNVTLVVVNGGGIAAPTNPDACVVGYSVAGASADLGASDVGSIPGAVVLVDTPAVVGKLGLSNVGVPYLGSTTFGYSIDNVPALVPVAFAFFGTLVVNPGVDLTLLGMPGCAGYTNADLGSFSYPVVGNQGQLSLPIPANASLIGTSLSAQAVAFSLATPLNLITSNGNVSVIGN